MKSYYPVLEVLTHLRHPHLDYGIRVAYLARLDNPRFIYLPLIKLRTKLSR